MSIGDFANLTRTYDAYCEAAFSLLHKILPIKNDQDEEPHAF